MRLPQGLIQPPNECSVMPFWFWNDTLDEGEVVRQIREFALHGVHGFIIHPRVGLPREFGWMSGPLLHFYRVAIDEACRRDMCVGLYDEGMYPSGSASGQVVAANPAFACRCLAKIDLSENELPVLGTDENLVAVVQRRDGRRMAVVDRKSNSVIRGLHYIGDGPAEDTPLAADILNPDAVALFLHLVYDGFAASFAEHFGKTVFGIFTDEPSLLGRDAPRDVWPGTRGILDHVNRILGYDFTPHLATLWHDDEPEALRFRAEYRRAVGIRLEDTYYRQLSDWCAAHGVSLTGHPGRGDDMGTLRFFQIPGQDLVWRWVLPDRASALEGPESTQAKCSSSAMIHAGRRRNANECCGAYGHELTWEEMQWLARWCFVRGVNLLYPHAFYYSVRGARRDERPPDVGPNSPWWERYREYADACRRLSWLNTDCTHVCSLAILSTSDYLPWLAAKVCHQHQRDFNYLEARDLAERATITGDGIRIADMCYRALIIEDEPSAASMEALSPFERAGRVVRYDANAPAEEFVRQINQISPPDVRIEPASRAIRVRHVRKCGFDAFLLFNEEQSPQTIQLHLAVQGARVRLDATTAEIEAIVPAAPIELCGYGLQVILVPSHVQEQ
jgi:hypothetical protein